MFLHNEFCETFLTFLRICGFLPGPGALRKTGSNPFIAGVQSLILKGKKNIFPKCWAAELKKNDQPMSLLVKLHSHPFEVGVKQRVAII